MKINTTVRKIVEIEITQQDAEKSLKDYQSDILFDMIPNINDIDPDDRSVFYWNLLQGEHTNWFNRFIEKYGINWITTPACEADWINLIEYLPNHFIKDLENLIEGVEEDNVRVTFNGKKIGSWYVINNC